MSASLRKRLGLSSSAAIFIFGILSAAYFVRKEYQYQTSAIESEVKKAASFLVPQAYLLLKQKDPTQLLNYTQVVQSIINRGYFCYIEVVDQDGNVIVPLDTLNRKIYLRSVEQGPWGPLAVGKDYILSEQKYVELGSVLEGAFGVLDKNRILGYVVLGVSTKPVFHSLWKSIGATILLLILLVALISILNWRFTRHATEPLLKLAEAVEAHRVSDSLEKFDIKGAREIEILAANIKASLSAIRMNEEKMNRAIQIKTESLRKSQGELKTVLAGFRKLNRGFCVEELARNIYEIVRSIVFCKELSVLLSVSEDQKELLPIETDDQEVRFLNYPSMTFQPNPNPHASIFPLISGEGKRFGLLSLGVTQGGALDESELATLQSLMEPVSMTLDNVFLYSQVERLAISDSMTGLLNRENIRARLLDSLRIARRENGSVYIIMADIDRFKDFNDRYGHLAGDRVIKTFAKILINSRRAGEFAGRPGGEEFLIVLKNTNLDGAYATAERLMEQVRGASVPLNHHEKVHFSVSIGIAGYLARNYSMEEIFDFSESMLMDQLIDQADRALYSAKSRGRDRIVVANADAPRSLQFL